MLAGMLPEQMDLLVDENLDLYFRCASCEAVVAIVWPCIISVSVVTFPLLYCGGTFISARTLALFTHEVHHNFIGTCLPS